MHSTKIIITSIYIFLLLAIINGCKEENIDDNIVKKVKAYDIYGLDHIIPAYKILNESFDLLLDIESIGPYILVLDGSSDPVLHLIESNNEFKYLKGVGNVGRGPGEFLTPKSIHKKNKDICVYDSTLLRITCYSLDQLFDGNLSQPLELFQIEQEMGFPMYLSLLTDTLFVSTGIFFERNRIAYYNLYASSASFSKIIGELPSQNRQSRQVPTTVLQNAYQSHIKVKPDGSLIVTATRHSDQLEVYKSDGNLLYKIIGETDFSPNYEVQFVNGSPVMASDENFRFGYIDLAVSNDYIFGLYSGRVRGDGNANFGTFIHCFDWEGNFIKSFSFEEYLFSINLNDEGSVIFGLEHYPEISLNIYKIDTCN